MRLGWTLLGFTAGCGLISGLDQLDVTDGSADASQEDADATLDAPDQKDVVVPPDADAGCPVEQGRYSMQLSGTGCGNTVAIPECIMQSACTITLSFTQSGGSSGISGSVTIASDGSFTNATITEGTNNTRTGCTGSWSDTSTTATLVIDCGGVNTSQSCVATLTRTSAVCN
jgi:hypothetical protein